MIATTKQRDGSHGEPSEASLAAVLSLAARGWHYSPLRRGPTKEQVK
jgi:hypothetical protein